MLFKISYDGKTYSVNERPIDGDAGTVIYYIRNMCGIPPGKIPKTQEIRAVCGAVKFIGKPLEFTVT